MKLKIPEKVKFIIDELQKKGYEAYAVGGCVRDALLGRTPNDWDITTSALPEAIISCFSHTIPTGIKHGTVTVMIEKEPFEVTTYRIDGEYSDNRHPDNVTFTSNLKEDLSRRDFTINAMAYNGISGITDLFGGMDDLKKSIVRTVGSPNERFNEDALRMIRAIRFSCQLGFQIDKPTFDSIRLNCELIKNVSIERIRDEFSKILLSEHPSKGIENLRTAGLLQYFMPEILPMVGFDQKNPHHDKDVYYHTLSVVDNTEPDLILRLSALLHDIAKPLTFTIDDKGTGHFYEHNVKGVEISEYILKRLRYDNLTIKKVSSLVFDHMSRYSNLKDSAVKRIITRVGIENLDDLFRLQIADIKGSAPPYDYSGIDYLKNRCEQILEQKQPLSVKDIALNGEDIMKLGYKPGRLIGETLNYLLEKVLESPELNNKETLKEMAIDYISSKNNGIERRN